MNYKVRVNNGAESKEAQELFFELGYSWYGNKKQVSYLESIDKGEFSHLLAWSVGSFEKVIQMGCGSEDAKEFTLSQLRTMVVLHRNDVNDANCTYQPSGKKELLSGYLTSDGWYYLFTGGSWQKHISTKHEAANKFTPIQKQQEQPFVVAGSDHYTSETQPAELPDPFLKEYLTPDYKLMLANGPQDGWIEVPEGSVHAIKLVNTIKIFVGTIVFMNAAGLIFIHGKTQEFTNGTYDTVEGYVNDGDLLIWSRHPQPKPEKTTPDDSDSPLDVMYGNEWSTVLNPQLLDVVYHYSASFNSARGSVSYDGVITFPGRITGIEDYRKVRAEIAKDGNVTPDQVNVHSLTIVG